MKVDFLVHELHPRREFRIARARRNAVRNVFVRLEHDGAIGWGEASPNSFYDETAEGVLAKLQAAAAALEGLMPHTAADVETAWTELWRIVAPSRAAQCALDLALWDWLARRENVSVCELVWGEQPKPVTTFCTIGLSSPDELTEKLGELRGFPAIKIKSDANADLAPIRAVRAANANALLAVDANCAWGAVDRARLSAEFASLGVAFLEQPLPPQADETLIRGSLALPVLADESCVTEADVERMARHFDGFNIKLVKCGGITPARRMAVRGRELEMKSMTGCMLESSVLIAAGAVIAQRTDYADLDGAWLLADDPFRGWKFASGVLRPALSVTQVSDL